MRPPTVGKPGLYSGECQNNQTCCGGQKLLAVTFFILTPLQITPGTTIRMQAPTTTAIYVHKTSLVYSMFESNPLPPPAFFVLKSFNPIPKMVWWGERAAWAITYAECGMASIDRRFFSPISTVFAG